MTAIPDLQRAADLLSEVFCLLHSNAIQPLQPRNAESDDCICTEMPVKCDGCNKMDTSPISLTTI